MNDATANPLGGLFGLQFQPQLLAYPNAVEDGITDNNKLTYTGQFNYEVNDTINVYGRYATGFKSASWNLTRDSRPFQADALALAAAGLLPNNYVPSTGRNFGTRYSEPETSEVAEIGFKAKGDWGTFNFAAFDQTIENFQSTIFQGTGFVLANAGTQSTRGIEWDSTFKLMDPLHVTFAGVLQDPVYDSFPTAPGPNGTVIDLSGQRPAGINELALSTSATYTHDFSDGISGFVRADYQYESDVQIVDNIAGLTRSTNIINASAGVGFDSGVSFMIWARNLNNDQSYTSAFPGVVQGATINAYPSQPRTYGASVRYTF
jgi:outer membrane receptor protein involved in Fe transport